MRLCTVPGCVCGDIQLQSSASRSDVARARDSWTKSPTRSINNHVAAWTGVARDRLVEVRLLVGQDATHVA